MLLTRIQIFLLTSISDGMSCSQWESSESFKDLKVSLVLSCCVIQHTVQPMNTNSCLYNKPIASRFSIYLLPTFLCNELRVINDVWRVEKKKVLNNMVYLFYFALQHCKWHGWQCLMTYYYVSSEFFLPATSKRHIFLHKHEDVLPSSLN